MFVYYGVVRAQEWGDLYVNLRRAILGANLTEIMITKDLRIPSGNATFKEPSLARIIGAS